MNNPTQTYTQNASDGVWQRPGHVAFAYSDGDDVENRIGAIIGAASDLSVLSTELRAHITDWPSNYHLSSQRANLLRPLKECLSGSVLEIGSGCGAITRFLGETSESVVALEGSRRRAQISRARTRDLSNVDVFCDEFSAFETEKRFDAVTLIGVLEYANMFVGGAEPALNMLEKAKALLKDEGCLVIAIENQLGLKYFAGAPEDHLGKAMLGLEDKYVSGGVRTYGKQALTKLLQHAGYESVEFLYPFPDYKMPASVLSQAGIEHTQFNSIPFLISTAGKDPQLALEPNFCLERAWPVIAANGLTADVSNSFLIVARRSAKKGPKSEALAWHYSTQRKKEFCKETTFIGTQDNPPVKIVRKTLTSLPDGPNTHRRFVHIVDNDAPYSSSPLLSDMLIDMVTRPGWTSKEISEFLRTYAMHVGQIGGIPLVVAGEIRWDQPIPKELFDCIPQNICVHKDGSASAFDLEWHGDGPIHFAQLVFRSLWGAIGELTTIGGQTGRPSISLLELIQDAMRLAGKDLSLGEARVLMENELLFQKTVSGKELNADEIWLWLKEGSLRQLNSQEALKKKDEIASAFIAQLAIDTDQISQYKQHTANLDEKILHIEHEHRLQTSKLQEEHSNSLKTVIQESLQSNRAIHQLTQQSANQYIHKRSLKNLIKQWRDYQNAQQRNQSLGPKPLLSSMAQLPSVAAGYWRNTTKLVGFSQAHTEKQAIQMMKESCHWPLPFAWHFAADDTSILDTISRVSAELGLETRTSLQSSLNAKALEALDPIDKSNTLIAIPRVITQHQDDLIIDWPLPDAELVRQAYIAMHCDQRIAAAFVGAPPAGHPSETLGSKHSVICLIRSSYLSEMAPTIQWSDRTTLEALRLEIEATQRLTADLGRFILVL